MPSVADYKKIEKLKYPYPTGDMVKICQGLKEYVFDLDERIGLIYNANAQGFKSVDLKNKVQALEEIRSDFETRRIKANCDKLIEYSELTLSAKEFDEVKKELDEGLRDKKKEQNIWLVMGGIVILLGLTQIIKK